MESQPEPSRADLATLGVVVLASAVLLAWSRQYCSLHSADSLIHAIISVTKITPYYWGQNRLGNVLPFVTAWITDIQVNFMAQVFLRALSASALPLLLIAIIRPRAPLLASFGAALALVLANFDTDFTMLLWVEGVPYALSGLMLAAAIRLTESRHEWWAWPAVFALLTLALFVNLSVVLFAGALLGLLAVFLRSRRYAVATVLLGIAFLLLSWHAASIGGQDYLAFQWALRHTSIAWWKVFSDLRFGTATFALGVTAMAALFFWQRDRRDQLARALAVIIATAFAIIVTANSGWPIANGWHPRYFVLYSAVLCALSGVLVAEVAALLVKRPQALAMAGVGLGLLTSAAAAWPLTSRCPRYHPDGIPQAVNVLAPHAQQFGLVLVAGDFWRGWPLVYELLKQRKPALGVLLRSAAIRDHLRERIEAANDVGLICIEPERICAVQYEQALGAPTFHGRPLESAMVKLTEGSLPDGRPYSVFRLKAD